MPRAAAAAVMSAAAIRSVLRLPCATGLPVSVVTSRPVSMA
jgi:hypothetical protein